jgi:hypothetical protein
MSVDYSGIAQNADALLADFGQTVTVTSKTAGAYDPATGTSAITTTTKTGYAVLLDYARVDTGKLNADGSPVLITDKQCYLSVLTGDGNSMPEPTPDMTLITDVGGTIYTVKNLKKISPAGTPVLYELNVRA